LLTVGDYDKDRLALMDVWIDKAAKVGL